MTTGIVRINRFSKPSLLSNECESRIGHGKSFEVNSAVPNCNVSLFKWYNTKSILMAANCVTSCTLTSVKIGDKKIKEYITINRPEAIANNNASIGGVDKQYAYYSLSHWYKIKKWFLKLITHAFDIEKTNIWLEYRLDPNNLGIPYKNQLDLLDFKEKLAKELITVGKSCRMSPGILPLKWGRSKSHSGSMYSSSSASPVPASARKRILIGQKPSNEMRLDKVDNFSPHDNKPHALVCKRTECHLKIY